MEKYDVIIVGAGIAGLTAAIYARRANKKVLVLEGKVYGGQIINTFDIENWPGDFKVSGVDLMQKIYKQATDLGAEIEFDEMSSIEKCDEGFIVKSEDEKYEAKSVILAVGTEEKKLGLPCEKELTGRGVSYCATCDGALYKDRNVAVIGGGNTALYDALYLSDIVKKIYLIHRRNEFRGDAVLVEKLQKKDNVEFLLEKQPAGIIGEEKVSGLKLNDGQILDIDGIFVAIGQEPMTKKIEELVELDEHGYIKAGEDCKTSRPGIFVAGDCRTKDVRQLVTAAGDGAAAAEAAVKYLNN